MNEGIDAVVDRLVAGGFFLEEAVEMLEKGMIELVLRQQGGNQSSAAKALGIHRNTLLRKMLQYGIDTKRPRTKPPARSSGHSSDHGKAKTVRKRTA
jgi:DNA-binding NtrC family response regulator